MTRPLPRYPLAQRLIHSTPSPPHPYHTPTSHSIVQTHLVSPPTSIMRPSALGFALVALTASAATRSPVARSTSLVRIYVFIGSIARSEGLPSIKLAEVHPESLAAPLVGSDSECGHGSNEACANCAACLTCTASCCEKRG
ncbi:hypothetical protein MJO28_002290 [Puccinia striiformis f. sp. tritici]|uniref:Uncharacterized protein n=1 Tax=Puccinia striiformis f. sp. tritici TaxID=168172 RepID=A0ACC0EX06_9BASI|nr:hypothetical protein MJO28_002290 [Puccinia striiformis f. sp. tritici]